MILAVTRWSLSNQLTSRCGWKRANLLSPVTHSTPTPSVPILVSIISSLSKFKYCVPTPASDIDILQKMFRDEQ
ncbi:hypothetical protein J6590_091814, partial [Homalodisca vitripennis]